MTSFIPESAPFDEEQRAWLNGFFAGLTGMLDEQTATAVASGASPAGLMTAPETKVQEEEDEDFPWHDAALSMDERMTLAQEKPIKRQLMAAMAQLDCGSCGYVCQTYAEAIADGSETNLTLCSPGGKDTKKMLKTLLADAPADKGAAPVSDSKPAENGFTRRNPYNAKLIQSRALNGQGSAKDTRHVAIDLGDSGITYNVGDALGVYPRNCDELVDEILSVLQIDPQATTSFDGETQSFQEILTSKCCLKDPSDELLELVLQHSADPDTKSLINKMIDDGTEDEFDVLDALQLVPEMKISGDDLIATLSPLNPRLYSIASSQSVVGTQVHLTVGKVSFRRGTRQRKGVASTMFSDRMKPGQHVAVFVQPNHAGFTIPADGDTPMIMVGPGTGIAPFISFLQQRDHDSATGDNWLFFGDQHQETDFLYQSQLTQYQSNGLLNRLDTAFSRDGDSK
ncbi:MAG: sulfite reductase subunit alpha, partial [Planctomycetota bacterium]